MNIRLWSKRWIHTLLQKFQQELREVVGSGERSLQGESLWGGEGFQAEGTWLQTGNRAGAWRGQGLPRLQCGQSRACRATASDREAWTQSYGNGELLLAMP